MPANPIPRALCINSTTNASQGLFTGAAKWHLTAPSCPSDLKAWSAGPLIYRGRIVSLTDGLLDQLGSGRGSQIESPQLVFSAFTDSC